MDFSLFLLHPFLGFLQKKRRRRHEAEYQDWCKEALICGIAPEQC